jgi:large subunit ribosomal protein L19
VEVIKKGKVRRAKLFYLRKMKGKAAKIREREKEEVAVRKEAKE